MSSPSLAHESSRTRRLALAALVGVLVASLPFTVHPWYDPTNDGSMYIATARALADGRGYTYLGSPFLIRPPGFSCLLAALVALRGTDFLAFNAGISLCGALGVLLFWYWSRARLGSPLALLAALVLWFNPGYQRLCNQVMSDVPGWAALLGGFLLARRWSATSTARSTLLLATFLAAATYLRSGNLLFLPALVVSALLGKALGSGPSQAEPWGALARRAALLTLAFVGLLTPWSLRNRVVAPAPPADQTLLYSYSAGMWHRDMGDPDSPRVPLSEVAGRLGVQGPRLLHTLGQRLGDGAATPATMPVALALLAFLALATWRRRAPEEWFCWGTLVVVAFYFGYASRLLLPVFAVALCGAAEGARDLGRRLAGDRTGLALGALPLAALLVVDWGPRRGWEEIRLLHEAYANQARAVRAALDREPDGDQARLGAFRPWHHAVYLERDVFGVEQAIRRGGEPSAAQAAIERYGLDHLLLTPLGLPASVALEERRFASWVARTWNVPDLGLVRTKSPVSAGAGSDASEEGAAARRR